MDEENGDHVFICIRIPIEAIYCLFALAISGGIWSNVEDRRSATSIGKPASSDYILMGRRINHRCHMSEIRSVAA